MSKIALVFIKLAKKGPSLRILWLYFQVNFVHPFFLRLKGYSLKIHLSSKILELKMVQQLMTRVDL